VGVAECLQLQVKFPGSPDRNPAKYMVNINGYHQAEYMVNIKMVIIYG